MNLLLRLWHASFKLAVGALYTYVIFVYAVYACILSELSQILPIGSSGSNWLSGTSVSPIRPAKTAKGSTSGMAGTNSAALCSCTPRNPAMHKITRYSATVVGPRHWFSNCAYLGSTSHNNFARFSWMFIPLGPLGTLSSTLEKKTWSQLRSTTTHSILDLYPFPTYSHVVVYEGIIIHSRHSIPWNPQLHCKFHVVDVGLLFQSLG